MNKAILILDKMPENCMECPLRFKDGDTDDWFRFRCHISKDQIPKEDRLWNCPLKPMPEKKQKDNSNELNLGYELGYNACIDEILGVIK